MSLGHAITGINTIVIIVAVTFMSITIIIVVIAIIINQQLDVLNMLDMSHVT